MTGPTTQQVPAALLTGLTLKGGWNVVQQITKSPDHTGGQFSICYIVEDGNGRRGFLKALDYSLALKTNDPPKWLQFLTSAYVHERELLYRCRNDRLRRVVVPIDDGVVTVPGNFGLLADVSYIIFELADGDVRKRMDAESRFDAVWRLRALHHAATALQELHYRQIAHQDLKASNVLSYSQDDMKITDLGTASTKGGSAPTDGFDIAGDPSHAPPELVYGYTDPDWHRRRFGCDLHLLGSLGVFLFTRLSITPTLMSKLHSGHRPDKWTATYNDVLPYVLNAWDEVMTDFRGAVASLPAVVGDRLDRIIRQLSHPDPNLRGDPRYRKAPGQQYTLVRYVSFFNQLALLCRRSRP